MKQIGWFITILLFAGFLRFFQLSSVPPALNSDEVAIGYNAYSILKTGQDEYGKRFPLTFRSFDDYKMPVYVYMVSGSMAFFGESDFAVRFPSALFGTLTVLVTFLLVRELFKKNQTLPLLASAFLAVSPWHLMFSRSGYEANVSVFFTAFGTWLLLKGTKKGIYILFASLAFSLAIWTYHTARIFVPLLLLGIAAIYFKELWKKKMWVAFGIFIGGIILFPIIKLSLSLEGQMRAIGVSSFTNPDDLKASISRIVFDSQNNLSIYSFFHNRRFEYMTTFLRGYFSHFDFNFLFLDKSIVKYRAPGVGLLYLFELPCLCIGVYQLIRKWSKGSALLFWWVLIAPVAAAFTLQLPHPVRTLVFLPALQVISAYGMYHILTWIKELTEKNKKATAYGFSCVVLCLIAVNVVYFFHQYFVHLPVENGSYWYVGRKEMVQKLAQYQSSYDRIIVSNQLDFPYIFVLYYGKVDPNAYLAKGGTKSGGFKEEGNTWGKYEFRFINVSLRSAKEKVLFVGMPGEEFKKALGVDTINYKDGSPAITFFK